LISHSHPADSLVGRTILVTGGSRGAGLAGVTAWRRLGAEIFVGTRSEERYGELVESVGGGGLHPFVADLSDLSSIDRAIELTEREGLIPTDIVHCAAGGLEPIMRPLMRTLMAMRRTASSSDKAEAFARHRQTMTDLVANMAGPAWSVNRDGPKHLIGRLVGRLNQGSRVIAYSSVWTSLLAEGGCPAFYRAIAESKAAFLEWMAAESVGWADRGVASTVVVIPLMADTSMGQLIDRHLAPLLSEDEQFDWQATYVSIADVNQIVTTLLVEPVVVASALRTIYVGGPNQVRDTLDPEVVAAVSRMPL
jgi:NAD(P)-dependent dehydrogenase (short-subunit alcohol dehydrogenase family)